MDVTRRDFLKWASLSAFGAVACNIFREGEMNIQSPVDMPEDLVTGQDNWYATLCGQCPEAEGIVVRVMEGRAKKVQGNPLYPTNQGKQSARCEAGLQALYHPDRLAGPLERLGPRGSGRFREIGWDRAMDRLRGRLQELRDGGDSGAMLTITGPLRGHLAMVVDGFVGSYGGRHLAFEPLDQAVLREAVKRVFNQDILPDFDIENSRYLLSFGADFLSTWVSPVRYARGYGEFRSQRAGKERGTFVHADPRYSMTAANADEWIPVAPGREGVLALSMAYVIISEGLADSGVVEAMTGGAGGAALDDFKPENIVDSVHPLYIGIPASIRGEPAADIIRRVATEFATRGPGLAIGGGEAAAHTNGLFNLSAIFALNFLVGSVGKRPGEGGIVFNPPPPLNELRTTSTSGSLTDWSQIASDLKDGKVKVLLVRGANPVYGLPDGVGFREALDMGDALVVSFSSFLDDVALAADLILPERISLEEWADDVPEPGPGYQMVGIQQPVVNPLPDLDPRSFPDLILTLSQDLALEDGLPDTFEKLLREGSDKLYDLKRGSPQGESPEALTKTAFWNKLLQQGGWWDKGKLSDSSSLAPPRLDDLVRGERTPSFQEPQGGDVFYLVPFLSNSLLDGRGAHLPWLQATPDPLTTVTWQTWIEINAGRAREMGLKEGDVVKVVSTEDGIEAIVYPHPAVPRDVVSIPVGEGHAPGERYAAKDGERRGVNPISILAPQLETETKSLAWAATRVLVLPTGRNVRVSKFEGIVPAFPIGTKEEDIVQVTRG